jgi:hypothetical protein
MVNKPKAVKLTPTQRARRPGSDVIPPTSIVRYKGGWRGKAVPRKGTLFRVGYYSRYDGLDVVWLVNESGKYECTTDLADIRRNFEIVFRARERSLYGCNRPRFGPLETGGNWDGVRRW